MPTESISDLVRDLKAIRKSIIDEIAAYPTDHGEPRECFEVKTIDRAIKALRATL